MKIQVTLNQHVVAKGITHVHVSFFNIQFCVYLSIQYIWHSEQDFLDKNQALINLNVSLGDVFPSLMKSNSIDSIHSSEARHGMTSDGACPSLCCMCAHLKGNVYVSCCDTAFSSLTFCSFKRFCFNSVFHVWCVFTLPMLGVCQAGSSLTEAGFASIDAAFPGGVWVSGILTMQSGNPGIPRNL